VERGGKENAEGKEKRRGKGIPSILHLSLEYRKIVEREKNPIFSLAI